MEQNETAQGRTNQARQFVMHECLGRGGFGEVYRSTMVSPGGLETEVAIKVLRLDVDPSSDAVSRLRDEGKLLAALRHPAILRAHDLALLDGRVALVTEFIDGADLHHCTTGEGRLTPRASLEVIEAIAEALDAAWTRTIEGADPLRLVHRDIKPSNIRLGSHGEVKLLDFGIARSDEVDREARTGTGSTVGSLAYMAPERFSRGSPGPEADVYALGCTLYEALVGVRFHDDPVPVEMFRLAATPDAHARHVADALEQVPAEALGALDLLESMLNHDKTVRPTAAEVAAICDVLAERLPGASLKRWARARDWNLQGELEGTFDGRTITEGSLASNTSSSKPIPLAEMSSDTFHFAPDELERQVTESASAVVPVMPAPASRHSPAKWVALVAVVALVIVAIWAVRQGVQLETPVGGLNAQIGGEGLRIDGELLGTKGSLRTGEHRAIEAPAPPTDQPVPLVPAVPTSVPAISGPAPQIAPQPTVSKPRPVAAPTFVPKTPEPAAPEPAVPEPVAEQTATVRKRWKNQVKYWTVELRGGGRTYRIDQGDVAVALGAYDIVVNGKVTGNQMDVRGGVVNHLQCNALGFTCSSIR